MKKRSAMLIAAGLVAALLSGAIALSMGFLDPAATTGERATPRVRTIERTVTVHKKAKTEAEPVVRTIAPAAPAAATSAVSDDGEWDDEDEGFEDEGFEDEDDEDDEDGEDD
jgi:hypothetical protein